MLKNPDIAHPSRLLRTAAWSARLALWLVLAVWSLFALSWGVLHLVIVPRVDQWRPALESVATRALGVTVTVGQVSAASEGGVPSFQLRDVRLLDSAGREALLLPQVRAALSVRSLWRRGFEQLVIDAPVLAVRRTTQGRIEVGGIELGRGSDDDGRLADWWFGQTELAVLKGELHWTDETRPEAPTLVLRDIDWVTRNAGRQHHWRLDATPPSEWGDRLSVRGRFTGPLWARRPGEWRGWSGTLYADLPRVDLRHLQQHGALPASWGLGVDEGRGALRAWADWQRGQVAGMQLDLALPAVALRWAQPQRAPFALNDLAVRLQVQRDGPRTQVSTQGLRFATPDGLQWSGGDVTYLHGEAPDGRLAHWALQADQVDLAPLQRLAQRLPVPAEWRAALADTQPEGRAEALTLKWHAAQGTQAERWSAAGRLQGLVLAPGAVPVPVAGQTIPPMGRPGLQGVDLVFDLDQAGGRAEVQMADGALVFPGVFEEPSLPLTRLRADVSWTVQGEQLAVDVRSLSFANADAEGQGHLRWHTADPATSRAASRFPGVLDLDLTMARANGARVHRYLPLSIPDDVRRYLREAVRQGDARNARFRVQGDLWDFPFADPAQGQFEVKAQLQNVAFSYVPPHLMAPGEPTWPALEPVQAELHIDRVGLLLRGAAGGVAGARQLQAAQVEARIADFTADAPLLQVRGKVLGPGDEALAFVNGSPLGGLLGDALREARLQGRVEVGLSLDLPLQDVQAVKVAGQLRLQGNDLRVSPASPWLLGTTGVLDFDEQGFRVPQTTARLLGGELRFQGGMVRQGGRTEVQFQGQGTATADGLRRAADMGEAWASLAALGQSAEGSTSYQVRFGVVPEGVQLLVESGLQGLALTVPAPLTKAAAPVLPLRVELSPLPPSAAMPNEHTRDRLTVELGTGDAPLLSARYEREHGPPGTRVLRGALSVRSERPALPNAGVVAQLDLGDIDLQAWERWANAWPAEAGQGAPPRWTDSMAYWPTQVGVSAERVSHGGRKFHDLVAGGSREGDNWRLSLVARELNGYIEYRPSRGEVPGRVYARLARLALPPATASEVEQLLQTQPRLVPALDVVVDDLELNDRRLGRLEVVAVNRQAPLAQRDAVREWRLNTLNLTVPEARLQASGNWAALGGAARDPAPRRTALNVQLNIADAGALLERFGMPSVVRGGRGTLNGTLGWLGSPLALDIPTLSGELQLDVQRGQFLKADPGLAKLLGVLSLQSLPRRLVLDFRDVFSEGFAFDFVRGDARIVQGVASTNNLQMKGVSAAVLLEGRADIARETQDITAVVIPELNAGTASLIATAISPLTGLGTFLAQFLLRQPLQEAATQQFHITGPWADPQVEKVNRRNMPTQEGAPARPGGPP